MFMDAGQFAQNIKVEVEKARCQYQDVIKLFPIDPANFIRPGALRKIRKELKDQLDAQTEYEMDMARAKIELQFLPGRIHEAILKAKEELISNITLHVFMFKDSSMEDEFNLCGLNNGLALRPDSVAAKVFHFLQRVDPKPIIVPYNGDHREFSWCIQIKYSF